MDYEFFLQNYDASAYQHVGSGAIPTPDLYLFIEQRPLESRILPELMPSGDDIPARISNWVATFADRASEGVSVEQFYEDADVLIYKISRPAPTLLELPDESSPQRYPRAASERSPTQPLSRPGSSFQLDES